MTRSPSLWLATIALACASLAHPSGQRATGPDASTSVSLQVSVEREDGTPVSGVTAADIDLIVDGAPSPITSFAPSARPISVVLLLDVTASMRMGGLSSNIVLQRTVEQWLPFTLKRGDRARVGTIAGHLFLSDRFSSNPHDFIDAGFAVRSVSPADRDGPSPIWDAIDGATEALEWEDNTRAVLVLTDGRATGNRKSLQDVGVHAMASAVSVHTIGERDVAVAITQVNGDQAHVTPSAGLRWLAGVTGGSYASDKPFPWSDPGPMFAQVLDRLHHAYTLVFSSAPDGKVHTVDIKVRPATLTVRVRKQFVAAYKPAQ